MYPDSFVHSLPLIVGALFTGGVALYALRYREDHPEVGRTFIALMVAITAWATTAVYEYMAPTLAGKVLAVKLEFLGLAAVGPLWLAFALRYTRRAHWLAISNRILLSLPGLVLFLLAFTNEYHHLAWTEVSLNPAGAPGLIVLGREPGFWLYALVRYGYLLLAAALYLQAFLQARQLYRPQIGVMVAGALVPLIAGAVYLTALYPVAAIDLAPFSFTIAGVLLAIGLFRFGLLDLQPIAARVVMDNLRDAVIVLDANDRVIDFNPAARELFGLREDVIGRRAPEALQMPELGRQSADRLIDVVRGEGEDRRWLQLTFSPLRDARHELLGRVALLHDVTYERALLKMREDLTHMIIHDLSNPLAAMHLALEMISIAEAAPGSTELTANPESLEALEIVRRTNLRAQRMIEGLLDVARLESGQMELNLDQVEPSEAAQAVLREMRPLSEERRLNLSLNLGPAVPPVKADPELLDRVLRNLVGNAIKYTPTDGRVTLSIRRDQAAEVVFTVRDTGPGLPESVRARLFEKFARGEGPEYGHGLGLAFCKLAVEAMGGRIWAESDGGPGATFHFTLPAG